MFLGCKWIFVILFVAHQQFRLKLYFSVQAHLVVKYNFVVAAEDNTKIMLVPDFKIILFKHLVVVDPVHTGFIIA